MLQTVQCPHCNRKLAIDSQHLGATVVCPMCKKSFEPAVEQPLPVAAPPPLPTPVHVVREEPPPPRQSAHTRPGDAYLDRTGIDVHEEHDPAVSSKQESNRLLQDWKEEMPPVQSAYQPSGRLPPMGVAAMLGGSVVGAIAGALASLAIAGITLALIVGVLMLREWMAATCGRVPCILVILAVVIGLVGGALSYGVLGWAAAAITTGAGMMGKNRNSGAAIFFSVGSAILALLLSVVTANLVTDWMLPEDPGGGGKQEAWIGYVAWTVEGIGSIIAIIAAIVFAQQMVQESKFCEDCEEYMEEQTLRGLKLGATRAVTRAVADGDLRAAADLLDVPEGKEGVPTLFHCARCEKGYFEVKTKFKCTWVSGDSNEEQTEEWLAASVELNPDEVEMIRRRGRSSKDEDTDD